MTFSNLAAIAGVIIIGTWAYKMVTTNRHHLPALPAMGQAEPCILESQPGSGAPVVSQVASGTGLSRPAPTVAKPVGDNPNKKILAQRAQADAR
jgi:hypothetical protein